MTWHLSAGHGQGQQDGGGHAAGLEAGSHLVGSRLAVALSKHRQSSVLLFPYNTHMYRIRVCKMNKCR